MNKASPQPRLWLAKFYLLKVSPPNLIVNNQLIITLVLQWKKWPLCEQYWLVSIMGNLDSAFCNPADEATLVHTTRSTSSCIDHVTMVISITRPEVHQ
jgi:hypothetical protein